MNRFINGLLGCTVLFSAMVSCNTADQEVEPIVRPSENNNTAIVTITPRETYTNVKEGDILHFDIAVDKLLSQEVSFSPVIGESSTGDTDDIEVVSGTGTLSPYSYSTVISIEVLSDHVVETSPETLTFNVDASEDITYNFQLHPDSESEAVSVTVRNYDVTVDWSAGTFNGVDLCESGVDLDLLIENADASAGNYDGASAACALEAGTLSTLPDGTYDIKVDFFESELPEDADVTIPYVVSIANNAGEAYKIEGSFNSSQVGDATVTVAQVIISEGVYTVVDANGTALGTM